MTLVCSLLLEDFSSVVLNISADPPRRQRLSQILSVEMAAAIVGKEESAPSLVQMSRRNGIRSLSVDSLSGLDEKNCRMAAYKQRRDEAVSLETQSIFTALRPVLDRCCGARKTFPFGNGPQPAALESWHVTSCNSLS